MDEEPRGNPPVAVAGSIGAANTELSKFILDDSAYIDLIILKLSGVHERYRVNKATKEIIRELVYEEETAYPQASIDWMERKLRTVLNKGTYLSQLKQGAEFDEMINMSDDFAEELYLFSDDFNVSPEQFTELTNIYRNSLSFGVRRAVGGAEKEFLSKTNSATTSNVVQEIRDSRPRGILEHILGRK